MASGLWGSPWDGKFDKYRVVTVNFATLPLLPNFQALGAELLLGHALSPPEGHVGARPCSFPLCKARLGLGYALSLPCGWMGLGCLLSPSTQPNRFLPHLSHAPGRAHWQNLASGWNEHCLSGPQDKSFTTIVLDTHTCSFKYWCSSSI